MPVSRSPAPAARSDVTIDGGVSATLIPLSCIPLDLNLNLNCVSVVSSTSSSNSPSSSSGSGRGGSIGAGSVITATARIRDGIVRIEEAACSSESIDEEDFRDNLEKVLNLSEGCGGVESGFSEDCDLDFDEFDDILDEEDDFLARCDGVSSTSSANSITLYSGASDSGSESLSGGGGCGQRRRKRHFSGGEGEPLTPAGGGSNSGNPEDEPEFLSLENPNALPCLNCQGGTDHKENSWPIKLDLDLLETLFQLCPEFFEAADDSVEMDRTENSSETSSSALDDPSTSSSSVDTHLVQSSTPTPCAPESSPPHVVVDDSPLQQSMDRNKESLKVKLLLRRPMNQLVEQGILPPPKTPAAFAGQRVRLERARMGDLLKAKIQQRPARQELIRQHILEDSNARVAPSLAEKQRMLKRARLADSLNDHLIHRPGPLELVQKNILHAPDAIIEQAIKEGVVPFKFTCEGHASDPTLPNDYNSDDDSSSDMSSPAETPDQSQASKSVSSSSSSGSQGQGVAVTPPSPPVPMSTSPPASLASSPSAPAPPIPPPLQTPVTTPTQQVQSQILSRIVQAAVTSTTVPPVTSAQLTLNKLSQLDPQQLSALMSSMAASQPGNSGSGGRAFMTSQGISFSSPQFQATQHASTPKSRSSKKSSKAKSTPKARQIKFHEYKGPPSAQKGLPPIQTPQSESSYELLLQQQQLFLQWQLEWQHKYPQIILPVVSKLTSPTEATGKLASYISAAAAVSMHSHSSPTMVTATNPTILSPSSISAVSNIGTPCPGPAVTQSGQQPIAPAPSVTSAAAQTFVFEKSPPPTLVTTNPSPIPFSVMVTSSTATPTAIEVRPTQAIAAPTIRPLTPPPVLEQSPIMKTELPISIAAKKVPSPSSTSTSMTATTTVAPVKTSNPTVLNMAKLNDWKVSDLKAELKKRNLPVSGPKPQLIERLKSSDLSLQDESISTTTTTTNSNCGNGAPKNQNRLPPISTIKNEVQTVESSSTDEMMETNESCPTPQSQSADNAQNANQNSDKPANGHSRNTALNAAMLALLGKNSVRNNGNVTPIQVFNAVPKKCTTGTSNSNPSIGTGGENGNKGSIVVVDETLILEQQKQIEQLQEALKNSQSQLQQMKLSQQGGGQKHRLALQQHLQHKMQQQALQAQLQKLIQLHSLQQQQQQEQAKPTSIQASQTQKILPQKIQISPQQQPQKADTFRKESPTAHQQSAKSHLNNSTEASGTVSSKIPFAIVQISTTTTTHLQRDATEDNLDNIPQLQIPETNNCAFQIGKNESGQGSKSIPDSISSDQMDHSWLLKINEVQPDESNSTNGVAKNYDGLFDSIVTVESKEEKKTPVPTVSTNSKTAKGFKSQMVDDVLEILIRNGELPPSAAQEPQTPTTPGKSPRILTYPTVAPMTIPPPPPPPLPPVTFAVTLPTSITFSRPTANLVNAFQPLQVNLPTTSNISADAKSSMLSTGIIPNLPQSRLDLTNTEALTKEAQDIQKISEDLSNFGRAHAESESQNRLRIHSQGIHGDGDDDGRNALAMLLGEVEKDLHLVHDMDVVLEDQSSQDFHISSQNSSRDFFGHGNSMNQGNSSIPMNVDSGNHHDHSNLHLMINGKHSNASDDLLDELGTLLPSDLDVPMPMEMDYSDWLDNLLPENNNSSSDSMHMNTNMGLEPSAMTGSDNNIGRCNNNFYDGMMDFNSDQFGQRDPLLSSRSLNIFSSSVPENPSASNTLSVSAMKSINRAPSPMAMGDNGLLWDFV